MWYLHHTRNIDIHRKYRPKPMLMNCIVRHLEGCNPGVTLQLRKFLNHSNYAFIMDQLVFNALHNFQKTQSSKDLTKHVITFHLTIFMYWTSQWTLHFKVITKEKNCKPKKMTFNKYIYGLNYTYIYETLVFKSRKGKWPHTKAKSGQLFILIHQNGVIIFITTMIAKTWTVLTKFTISIISIFKNTDTAPDHYTDSLLLVVQTVEN